MTDLKAENNEEPSINVKIQKMFKHLRAQYDTFENSQFNRIKSGIMDKL
jgi:hypothetical protein